MVRDVNYEGEDMPLKLQYAADPHHGGRILASISKLRSLNVKAFGSYEEALRRLALTKEAIAA